MLLARLDYVPAFLTWSVLMSILFVLCAIILIRLVPQAQGWDRWILLLGTALFFPAFFSVINGQDTALLFTGSPQCGLYGLIQERDRLAGLGLALTLIRPHMGVMLALPFIFRRRKVWWWFVVGAGRSYHDKCIAPRMERDRKFPAYINYQRGMEQATSSLTKT